MTQRILIVDDEAHIRRMMRLTLETAGYEVVEARDGTEGIKLFGDGSGWSAVILDQRMPGMDGLETLREIKTRNADARIVMATAYASIELAVDAMKLGATDFVRKPMTPEVLRNAVTAALSKPLRRELARSADKADAPLQQLQIQTVTMNGFMIIDDEEVRTLETHHRRFVAVSPNGEEHEVLVEIEMEAVEFVARMIGRDLPAENSFWTSQARRLLSDYLWNEGNVPPTRRLILKDLDAEKLSVAARWSAR